MEAFDISNISGFESVGSMVVYEKGRPKRSAITVNSGSNRCRDLMIMPVWKKCLPDVLLMKARDEYDSFSITAGSSSDGWWKRTGKYSTGGVWTNLGLHIPVCGMVKDDHHRTRGLYYNNVEIPIDTNSEGFRLITRIQDEAHRFAIEYHRSLQKQRTGAFCSG